MWFNEFLFVLMGILATGFIIAAWKLDKERLYSAIVIFLILIATVGGKVVEFFGHETNSGNIFYASIFLTTYFLIERYGKKEGKRSIWIGVIGASSFFIFVQLAIFLEGSTTTLPLNIALANAFSQTSRLILASLSAYILSQSLNVYLYVWLKNYFNGEYLWWRANAANAIAQILDSVVFFLVAFWGIIHPDNVWDILITGYLIKVVYMMIVSPVLYLNRIEENSEDGEVIIQGR